MNMNVLATAVYEETRVFEDLPGDGAGVMQVRGTVIERFASVNDEAPILCIVERFGRIRTVTRVDFNGQVHEAKFYDAMVLVVPSKLVAPRFCVGVADAFFGVAIETLARRLRDVVERDTEMRGQTTS